MAQVKKKHVQDSILAEARKEFLRNGFQKASLRQIASASKVSLANLYSYYKNKDSLFCAVTENLRRDLNSVEKFFREYQPSNASLDSLNLELDRARLAAQYIHKNIREFHLLFNQSQGSSLGQYSERLVDGYVVNCRKFLAYLKKNDFPISNVPSDFFFASIGRMFVEAVKDSARSKLSIEAIEKYAEEITQYNHFGFQGVSSAKKVKKGIK